KSDFNYDINELPRNLIKLSITKLNYGTVNFFSKSLDMLPSSLKILKIDSNYCNKLTNLPNLTKLIFSKTCRYEYTLNNLPSSLKVLELPIEYSHDLLNLPELMCLKIQHSKNLINF